MQRWDERRQLWAQFGREYDALGTGHGHYDRAGKPISALKWARCMKSQEYRVVNHTFVGDFYISTVWLGLSHNFSGTALPVIFETAVFGDDGLVEPGVERYTDIREALHGHDAKVAKVRASLQ